MFITCGVLIDGTGGRPRPGAIVEVRDGHIAAIHDRPVVRDSAPSWPSFSPTFLLPSRLATRHNAVVRLAARPGRMRPRT